MAIVDREQGQAIMIGDEWAVRVVRVLRTRAEVEVAHHPAPHAAPVRLFPAEVTGEGDLTISEGIRCRLHQPGSGSCAHLLVEAPEEMPVRLKEIYDVLARHPRREEDPEPEDDGGGAGPAFARVRAPRRPPGLSGSVKLPPPVDTD